MRSRILLALGLVGLLCGSNLALNVSNAAMDLAEEVSHPLHIE